MSAGYNGAISSFIRGSSAAGNKIIPTSGLPPLPAEKALSTAGGGKMRTAENFYHSK
jgi:hypothetical protein